MSMCAHSVRHICTSCLRVCVRVCVCSLLGLCADHVMAYTSTEATKELRCQHQHSDWQAAIPPQRLMGWSLHPDEVEESKIRKGHPVL